MVVESTQSTLSSNHECADKAKFAKLWVNRKTLLDEKRQKTVQCAVMSMTKDGDTDGYTAPEMSWKLISIHPGIYWNILESHFVIAVRTLNKLSVVLPVLMMMIEPCLTM